MVNLPRIYPITDVRISGLSHAEQVRRLIAGGASLIQLREKHASPRDFYDAAAEAVDFARSQNVKMIINDRVDIALALKAAGVHLGQDDMPPDEARKLLGKHALIGFSTHSLDQARTALQFPIDYIAFGPIFPTKTKADPDKVVGLDGLRKVRAMIGDTPLVAIGGITVEDLRSVIETGADSAAIIGAILSEPAKIDTKMSELLNLAENTNVV